MDYNGLERDETDRWVRTSPKGGSGVTRDQIERQNRFYTEVILTKPVFTDKDEQIEMLKRWVLELHEEIEQLKKDKVDKYNQEITLC